MTEALAARATNLRERMVRYLGSPRGERRVLREHVLPTFTALGPTVIIGGMVRDIARAGGRAFASDVDLVIQPRDYAAFRDRMRALDAVENRFGGFGLRLSSWRVDVWALQDTWARRAGYREVTSFDDLLGCTFFDWDAVLFDVGARRVICRPDYIDRLAGRTLGLNLEANPNAVGSAVRTLRRALLWRVRLADRLAEYVLDVCREVGWARLVDVDREAFRHTVLERVDGASVIRRLERRLDGGAEVWNATDSRQLPLPLCA